MLDTSHELHEFLIADYTDYAEFFSREKAKGQRKIRQDNKIHGDFILASLGEDSTAGDC